MEFKRLVSVIIPARNEEASIAKAVASVVAQMEADEVIVVNDGSTDKTGAILKGLCREFSKMKIIDADVLPAGWIGKNHAVSVGAAAATGDWLLFADADTVQLPGAILHALKDAAERDATLVSYSPEQEMESLWERALIPFVFCRLSARYSFDRVNDPTRPDAAANGQFLMVRRDAYEAVGGHTSVAGEVLEDVALARRLKQAGYSIYFAAPRGVVRTRMYRSFGAMWEGWTKNLYLLMGSRPVLVFVELIEASQILKIALFVLSAFLVFARHPASAQLMLIFAGWLFVYGHIRYAATLRRNLFPISLVQYYLAGDCLYSAALTASWWKDTRGAVQWKGREYPAKGTS